MSILIINASPRKSGNSTFIAESLKEKYGDSCQVVNLAELNIKPCTSCRSCKINNSFCVIKDDISDGNMAANWAKGFFEQYGLKTFTFVIPNCGYDNTDGVKIKLDEIKMNVSMFFN